MIGSLAHSCDSALTLRKDVVVWYGGRWEAAPRPLGVQLLQSGPLSAAVDPGSPPRPGGRALHRPGLQTAGGHAGTEATETQRQSLKWNTRQQGLTSKLPWILYSVLCLNCFGNKCRLTTLDRMDWKSLNLAEHIMKTPFHTDMLHDFTDTVKLN